MPKIQINEFDRTGVVQRANISNIVYLPLATTAKIELLNTRNKSTTLCSSTKELDALLHIGETGQELIDFTDKYAVVGYNIAKNLILSGFQVLIEGIVPDSGSVTIPETTGQALIDKGLFDVRFLTAGMYNSPTNLTTIATIASTRKDCIALISLAENPEALTLFDYTVATVRTAFEGIAAVASGEAGKYAAGFTPWFETNNATLTDKVPVATDEKVYIPAGFGYLFAYANMLANNVAEWNAVAGPQRGIVPGLADVCYDYTSADIEVLQARAADGEVKLDDPSGKDNVGVAINPICYVRPSGYMIYGNRTLKNNTSTEKTTAQSFLNVRNGVNAIKKTLYNASRAYVFEQNTDVLFINFKNYLTPLLERMKNGGGLMGYSFVKVATTAKARLRARLTIIPVEAVEDFEIDVYLVDDLTVSEE